MDALMVDEEIIDSLHIKIKQLKKVLSETPGCIYWKDKNGVYLGCNRIFLEMVDLQSEDEVIGKTDQELPWKEQADMLRKHDLSVMESGEIRTLEEEVTLASGEKQLYSVVKGPLHDEDGNVIGIVGTSINITYRKKLEERLSVAKMQAEASSEAKSEFIANMSHDIRTPLTGLLGMAQAIQSCSTDQEIQYDASLLITCAEELLNLFNEIIDLIHIESGNVKYKEESFSLRHLIQHNQDLLIPAAKHKQISLETKISDEIPNYIHGNKILLDRIILNLLSNAIKFTENGGVTLQARLLPSEQDHQQLELVVEDTGIGIPEDKKEAIFEHFSRVSPSYKGIYKGSGLGLYTVKRYLEALAGDIRVVSKLGQGSCFTVILPIVEAKPPAQPEETLLSETSLTSPVLVEFPALDTQADAEEPTLGKLHILLVEDQYIAAKMAINMLKKLQCVVDYANSGEKALEMLKERHYDVIYMDIGLPGINGLETTQRIRALSDNEKASVPIVGLTAHMSEKKRDECINAGMQDMLTKPLTLLAAEEIIQQYVFPSDEKQPIVSKDIKDNIDMEEAVNLASGNEKLAKELLDMLAESLPEDVRKIKEDYFKKDWHGLYQNIHRLYGAFCYCGVPRLRKAGKALHEAVEKKDEAVIQTTYQDFCIAVEQFMHAYQRLIS